MEKSKENSKWFWVAVISLLIGLISVPSHSLLLSFTGLFFIFLGILSAIASVVWGKN